MRAMALNNSMNSVSSEMGKIKKSVQDGMGKVSRALSEQTTKAVRIFTNHVTNVGRRLASMTKEEVKMAVMTLAVATVMMLLPGLLRHVKLSMRLPARRGLQVPKGSLGLPFVGEDINLKAQQQSFYNKRRKRYGDLFRTHLFGYPSIVVTDPEAAKYVLVDQSVLFKQLPLPEVGKILGSKFFGYQNHRVHARLRKVMQSPLLAMHNAIPYIEALALGLMYSWEGRTVNALEEIHHYTFDVATHFIIGAQPKTELESLRSACANMFSGVGAWPINLIGTNFWWAKRVSTPNNILQVLQLLSQWLINNRMPLPAANVKGTKSQACAIIDQIIFRRRLEGRPHGDILGLLMDTEDDNGVRLTPEEIHDNILTLLYDARDTAAAALTWVLKNLNDYPHLLAEVTREQDKIRHKKLPPESVPLQWSDIKDMPLTWADIKEMPLTQRVIKETLRLGNLVDFSYREALEDVEYEGSFFPKGWRVLVVHANFHLNPDYFTNPLEFDPSRFEGAGPPQKTFTPFGNGAHVCLGRELAQLEIFIFIHHFVTRFKWTTPEPVTESVYRPIRVPRGGMPIFVTRKPPEHHVCHSDFCTHDHN